PGFRWTPAVFERHRSSVEAQFRRMAEEDEEFEAITEQYWTHYCNTSNWTLEFIELLLDLELMGEIDQPTIPWSWLAGYASGSWTPEFMDAYRHHIDWAWLAFNPHFPWTERLDDFAEHLSERAWRELSQNKTFTPTASTLLRYADRWAWGQLSEHLAASIETLV